MDEALDFKLKLPSLMELAQIKIAHSLWSSKLVTNSSNTSLYNDKDKVKSQISVLPIPRRLQKDLETYVNFVGVQISLLRQHFSAWQQCYFQLYDYIIKFEHFPDDKLRWTAYGVIDFDHLARAFVQDDRVPIARRYEMSCNFCWQESVDRLWNEMEPAEFHQKKLNRIENWTSLVVYFWSCVATGKPKRFKAALLGMDRRRSTIECVFEILTESTLPNFDFCKVPRLKFFWEKMTEAEKRCQIERLKTRVPTKSNQFDHCEGWCYFLSQMDPDDRMDILKRSPAMFLKVFLNRPWQHLFFPVLRLVEGCQNFTDSLPWFLGEISLDQCDEAMRRRFFHHLRPLFPKYLYDNAEAGRHFRPKLRRGQHEYVFEIMRDATEAQKIAFVMDTLNHPVGIDVSHAPFINVLVEAWVTRDGWPDLKAKLELIFDQLCDASFNAWGKTGWQLRAKNVRKLIDSLDEHFVS